MPSRVTSRRVSLRPLLRDSCPPPGSGRRGPGQLGAAWVRSTVPTIGSGGDAWNAESVECRRACLHGRRSTAYGAVTAARDRFAGLLGGIGRAGASSARRTARPDDLRLEVRDVGPIAVPVPVRQAKQLCLVGRPARFGKGEQTLLDRGVRDTWEIPRSRIKIDKQQWDRTLRPVLDRLRADLGLPTGCVLNMKFHAMLVYGPGQFFASHQDSEKADAMIGTLVVMLPSDSQGGALVVQDRGTSATYRASKTSLSFVAFYADCRHEVRPVTSGYRVVLTYNLLLTGDTTGSVAARVDPAVTKRLGGLLGEHFSTRVPARYGDTDRDPPTRLVYLLDREYTERGLS